MRASPVIYDIKCNPKARILRQMQINGICKYVVSVSANAVGKEGK